MLTPLDSFDELTLGQRFEFGSFSVSQEEIIEYASKYDPQSFHLDPEAAKAAPLFGGLVASGLHTMGCCFGLIMRSGLWKNISLGGSQIDTKWPTPLRPDETVAVTGAVDTLNPSKSRPTLGVVLMRYTGTRIADQRPVIEMVATHFLRR